MNDKLQATKNFSKYTKFKTSVIKSSRFGMHYSNAYIHVKGTITVPNTETAAAPNNRNEKVMFKK